MGYTRHHAIVVSSWNIEHLKLAHYEAVRLGTTPSEMIPYQINGGASFLIPPDGSKEGWDDSDAGDARRKSFKDWLHNFRPYGPASMHSLDWVEVEYGGDGDSAIVVDSVHADQAEEE